MDTCVQCHLVKGNLHRTGWIPKWGAVEGKLLKLKEDGEWNEGWRVTAVGSVEMDEKYVNERSQDYKHTRGASDI